MQPRAKTFSKNSELFVAICTRKTHSFIVVGIHDKDNNKKEILFSLGKGVKEGVSDEFSFRRHYLLSKMDAEIHNETFFYHGDKERKISYKAFTITDNQYQQLLDIVSKSKHVRDKIMAYRLSSTPHRTVNKYKLTTLQAPDHEETQTTKKINDEIKSLHRNSNCRTTAITFLDILLDSKYKDKDVSSNPLARLPFQTTLKKGRVNGDFYILPQPPRKDDYSLEQHKMLKKLYRQLEAIPRKDGHAKTTKNKFANVKRLYEV